MAWESACSRLAGILEVDKRWLLTREKGVVAPGREKGVVVVMEFGCVREFWLRRRLSERKKKTRKRA